MILDNLFLTMRGLAITRHCLPMVKQGQESLGPLLVTAQIEVREFLQFVCVRMLCSFSKVFCGQCKYILLLYSTQ